MTKKKLRLTRMLRISGGQIPSYAARSAELDTVAGYDAEGRLETVQYPLTGQVYKYLFDSRGMPSTLRDETNAVNLVGVTYGLAGEMLTFGGESRSYNVNGQLTNITMPGGRSVTYNFPAAGSNNSKVASIVDSGETITYQYDSLQRLISATGSGWSQTYTYDGFGNLYGKAGTGTAPSWGAAIDAATNRMGGVSYDANGNQLFAPMTAGMPDAFNLSYDVSNRMTTAATNIISKKTEYEYDPGNKRITEVTYTVNAQEDWVRNGETLHFFGITGQRLATFDVYTTNEGFSTAALVISPSFSTSTWVWFGRKLVKSGSTAVNEDRLGSVGRYLPYGEDKPGATNPANGDVKFATYTRDASTGIDYSDQRWHAQGTGRFLSSDPYQASAGPRDPGSWNRYGYVVGDPVNLLDPWGTCVMRPNDRGFVQPPCGPFPDPQPPAPEPAPQRDPPVTIGGGPATGSDLDIALGALSDQKCATALGAVNGEMAKITLNNTPRVNGDPTLPNGGLPTATALGNGQIQFSYQGARTDGTAIFLNTAVYYNLTTQRFDQGAVSPSGIVIRTVLDIMRDELGAPNLTEGQAQAVFLLHELGHILNMFPDDTGSSAMSKENSKKVYNECIKNYLI